MYNSGLLNALNDAAKPENQINEKRIVQEKNNRYCAFFLEFENALIKLVKFGDFIEKNNKKQIEGRIAFERDTDLEDCQSTDRTVIYGLKNSVELSDKVFLGFFTISKKEEIKKLFKTITQYVSIDDKEEIHLFINRFNKRFINVAKIYDYDECITSKKNYDGLSSKYTRISRVFYFKAKF